MSIPLFSYFMYDICALVHIFLVFGAQCSSEYSLQFLGCDTYMDWVLGRVRETVFFRWIYEMSSFRCWSFWDVTVAFFYHSSIADAISDGVQICCSLLQVLLDSFCWMFRHTVVPVHRNGTQSGWGLTKWLTKPNGLVLGEGETSLHLSFPPATWSLPILGCVILVNWMSSRSPNDQSHCQERDVTTWPSLEDSDYFSSWHQSGVDQL